MRHDHERAICETVAAYLEGVLDAALIAAAPVVSFYDPMALDDADRITVICERGETKASQPGNFTAQVEVGVKTRLEQPDMANVISTHFERVNAVRDVFSVADPAGDVSAHNVAGIEVTHIESVRRFSTDMGSEVFIYSKLELTIHGNTANEV